jgi:hypothetical protein
VARACCCRLHVASSRAGVKWESTPPSPALTPLPPPFPRSLVRRAVPLRPRRGRASSPPHGSLPNFTHSSALGSRTFPYIALDPFRRGEEVLSIFSPLELTGVSPPPRSTVASSPPSFYSCHEPRSHLRHLWGCLWRDLTGGCDLVGAEHDDHSRRAHRPASRRSVAGVVRASLHLLSLPQSVRLVAVKLVQSSDVTVQPRRRQYTATRPSPAAAHDGEPLPLQPEPSFLHESKHLVTENARVCLVSRASSPPTSLSSPERAVRRAPVSLSLTAGPACQCRARAGALNGPHARRGPRPFPGRPSSSETKFIFIILSLIFVQVGKI